MTMNIRVRIDMFILSDLRWKPTESCARWPLRDIPQTAARHRLSSRPVVWPTHGNRFRRFGLEFFLHHGQTARYRPARAPEKGPVPAAFGRAKEPASDVPDRPETPLS